MYTLDKLIRSLPCSHALLENMVSLRQLSLGNWSLASSLLLDLLYINFTRSTYLFASLTVGKKFLSSGRCLRLARRATNYY
jgi:hypothetical protein